ncbi:MAG: flagellar hook protein FlgE [Burkholderiaceae bacterium]
MGFQHGLSGLNAASKNLDVIGHNVANANTVGAKTTRAEFADMYANAAGGALFSGLGVQVKAITQQFSQGDLTGSSNPLDLAVNGSGFFRLEESSGSISYTRNGQFKLDSNGNVVSAGGMGLTGFPADINGQVRQGVAVPLKIDRADLSPKMTTEMSTVLNLDSREEVPTTAFDPADATSFNSATSLKVFDAQGRDTTVAMYFQKTGNNTWDIYATADGTQIGAAAVGSLTFDATGGLDPVASPMPMTLNVPTGGGTTVAVAADLSKVTQYGAIFGVNELDQDGFTTGQMAGFSVSENGTIVARYTNGETRAQGQIALANFANQQGLAAVGDNSWIETAESGTPLVGSPGSASLGGIRSGALEQSNVDLTGELVSMIMAQRSYQANAQTIKTQDQILQTIVNLR